MFRTSTTRWPEPVLLRTFPVAAAVLLTACSAGPAGPVSTEERGVDAFHSIDLRGAADVSVLTGTASSVAITASAGALKTIDTHVQNGVLIIDNKQDWGWLRHPGKAEVRITLPSLNALAVNGAGNVTINGINDAALSLVIQGAGNIEASGATSTLNARINGAGDMDLSHLVAGDATISVNGTGNMSANVTGSLEATVNGVGSITYAGNPQKLDTKIHGVGSIAPAGPRGN